MSSYFYRYCRQKEHGKGSLGFVMDSRVVSAITDNSIIGQAVHASEIGNRP